MWLGGQRHCGETPKEEPMSDEYDARCKQIVSVALAAWVGSLDEGIGLGDAQLNRHSQTKRTVQDAVKYTYHEGITDDEWLAATLRRLEGK
jgi:hypothetical protein